MWIKFYNESYTRIEINRQYWNDQIFLNLESWNDDDCWRGLADIDYEQPRIVNAWNLRCKIVNIRVWLCLQESQGSKVNFDIIKVLILGWRPCLVQVWQNLAYNSANKNFPNQFPISPFLLDRGFSWSVIATGKLQKLRRCISFG